MFVPVKFVHPVRTERWRLVSLPAAAVWTALAGWAALSDLTLPGWARAAMLVASTHLLLAGVLQQVLDRTARRGDRPAAATRG
jgi:phosphatidylcholine synthase